MIVGAIRGMDAEHRVPVFTGKRARCALVALYGLPNAAPTAEEWRTRGALALFSTRRVVFVDDWNDGQPRAVWLPDESTSRAQGGR